MGGREGDMKGGGGGREDYGGVTKAIILWTGGTGREEEGRTI